MSDESIHYLVGDAHETLSRMERRSVHLVVTSPPYFTLNPIGRSAEQAASGLCGHDCEGYTQVPLPGGLWPGERYGDSLGHMPWHDIEALHEEGR